MNFIIGGNPSWFMSSGILMELVFALVTIMISVYAYKIYKITKQRNTFLFGGAFFSIALAYFVQASLNFLISLKINSKDLIQSIAPSVHNAGIQLSILAVFLHIFFMITGLVLLSYVTLKERNHQTFALLMIISFLGLLFAHPIILFFEILSSMFLLFITIQYYQRHSIKGTSNTLMIYLSFGMLFLGTLQLAGSSIINTFYFLGHLTSFIGYLLLLINFWRVVK